MNFRSTLVGVVLLAAAPVSCTRQGSSLDFELDLRAQIRDGWLDPVTESVGLRGDHAPLSWGSTYPAEDRDGDGIYDVRVPFDIERDSLVIAFKIKVDGVDNPNDGWQVGPNHVVTLRRGRSERVSIGWADRASPPTTITGRVEVIRDMGFGDLAPRDIFVYLPPDYEETDERYPVLYMQDGQNIFDAALIGQEWHMDEAAELLIRTGEIEPLIIVGIGNTSDRIEEYTPTRVTWRHRLERIGPPVCEGRACDLTGTFSSGAGETVRVKASGDTLLVQIPGSETWDLALNDSDSTYFLPKSGITVHYERDGSGPPQYIIATKPPRGGSGDRYGDLVVNGLKPEIDSRFRTRPEREWTAMGGSSLGGLITMYLGLEYPGVFGHLLVISSSAGWDGRWIVRAVDELPGPTAQRIWLDIGADEGEQAIDDVRALNDALTRRGWSSDRLHYVEVPGAAHSEGAWAERVPDLLRFLFQQ